MLLILLNIFHILIKLFLCGISSPVILIWTYLSPPSNSKLSNCSGTISYQILTLLINVLIELFVFVLHANSYGPLLLAGLVPSTVLFNFISSRVNFIIIICTLVNRIIINNNNNKKVWSSTIKHITVIRIATLRNINTHYFFQVACLIYMAAASLYGYSWLF